MTVICQLHEAGRRLSVSNIKDKMTLSVSYIRQVDCYLSVTWGWLSVSVSYMRQDDGYLSVTLGRWAVICQLHEVGSLLSVSYMGQVIGVSQIHEAG